MADIFTPELTFGNFKSGIMAPTAPGAPYRTIQPDSGAFSPLSLFASGEKGAYFDPSVAASVFQDSGATIPALPNDPVGCLKDLSGNNNHIIQATAGKRPILRLSGGLYYLQFDGIDDALIRTGMAQFTSVMCLMAVETFGASGYAYLINDSGPGADDIWHDIAGAQVVCRGASGSFNSLATSLGKHVTGANVLGTGPSSGLIYNDAATQAVAYADATGLFDIVSVGSLNDGSGNGQTNFYGGVVLGGRQGTGTEVTDTQNWLKGKIGL